MKNSPKNKSSEPQLRNREATRIRLIEAVGTLLAREGFRALGVNAVAREAGVDKALIYRYFGGLKGLIASFGGHESFWPPVKELAGGDLEAFVRLPIADRASQMTINYMRAIRKRPITQEIMVWEVLERNEFTIELDVIRENTIKRFFELFMPADELGPDVEAMTAVIACAIDGLIISSRKNLLICGLQLGTDEAWQRLEKAIERMVRSLIVTKGESQ
jgi:AcrR family transcriptional regulator